MKYLMMILAILVSAGALTAQDWKWAQAPKAGINANLMVSGIPDHEGGMTAAYYYYKGTELMGMDAGMVAGDEEGEFIIPVPVPESCSWIAVVLKDGEQEAIASTNEYVTNDNAMVKAWEVEKAMAWSRYFRVINLDRDDKAAMALLRDAVITDPKWLQVPDVLSTYYGLAKSTASAEDMNNIKVLLTNVSQKPKDYSEDMLVQSYRLALTTGDTVTATALRKSIDKQYPKSILMQEDALAAFKKADALDQQMKIRDQFITKYPVTEKNKGYLDQMTSTIVQKYADNNDWDNVKKYSEQIINPLTHARVCNNYAWTLSGESIEKEGERYDIAENLSATSLKLLTPDAPKPSYLTSSEWQRSLDYNRGQYSDTYALIRYKQGHLDDAVNYQAIAVRGADYESGELNERYARYLEKYSKTKELETFLDKVIVMGKSTEKMNEMHRDYWTKSATADQLYKQYRAQLDKQAHDLLAEKVSKKWKEDESIAFSLKDLQGNLVSLNDYKGKTVILDFWATWCGPCKASFPGMKKAVEYFASDKDVVFLFVDTWESGDNIEDKVSAFIKENYYPFHVIMDSETKVVEDYKVTGIPTKFIIGPDQKVRFVSVGFNGSSDELFEEMKIMVEMARAGGLVKS